MSQIFSNLPLDIIKHILLFDKNFILRKSEIVTVIPKDDKRYSILNYIVLKKDKEYHWDKNTFKYTFLNYYDGPRPNSVGEDSIYVKIHIKNKTVDYEIWVGRLKPINENIAAMQMYDIVPGYEWSHITHRYSR